ncbi:MAG: exodeoxyribonuclease VII large subunit, partial [Clostridia bacterium]|nr:exodeoxyribonuclease VII large subunit [Clostridia bacterium]
MIRILSARFPLSQVIVCPVSVQGSSAAAEIAEMLDYIDKYRVCDLIICGRGGGSVEDLWAFNEEITARAIARCGIPVISAVGHEPDVTIADYVADVRASTPSNAAEIAVPDASETKAILASALSDLINAEKLIIAEKKQELTSVRSKKARSSPLRFIYDKRMLLSLYEQKLSSNMNKIVSEKKNCFIKAASTLDALSPLKLLAGGYSVVKHGDSIVKSVDQIKENDILNVFVKDGKIKCSVLETEETQNVFKQ